MQGVLFPQVYDMKSIDPPMTVIRGDAFSSDINDIIIAQYDYDVDFIYPVYSYLRRRLYISVRTFNMNLLFLLLSNIKLHADNTN